MAPFAIIGLGYVPFNEPPAVPDGGKVLGITPGAILAAVTEASTSFGVVTELSASLGVVTELSASFEVLIALFAIDGLGYKPVRSPLAVPFGGNAVGITPGASLTAVTDPSTNFGVVTTLSLNLFVLTVASAIVGFG